ncbi:hypothetical protein HNQ60_004463 [Povalibacter uvarum]|uniref:Uncharacterized protein n=1 Tax=Povalibacter uvarum TaxID=732238 RepID=A0A841HS28_9GAMM|nr:hypothetical protein [Povalibacter uvarum]MBB6095573.1 hypothetical protein [Povalibacter uvarum]
MKESGYIDFTDTSETEVELTAQDLLSLPVAAASAKGSEPVAASIAVTKEQPAVRVQAEKAKAVPSPARKQGFSLPKMAWGVGLAVVGGVVVAANHMYSAPKHIEPAPVIVSTIPQEPDPVVDERPPTLVTNPFDPSEVFELAPDLSEEEARIAVEQLLLERASQRHAGIGGIRSSR